MMPPALLMLMQVHDAGSVDIGRGSMDIDTKASVQHQYQSGFACYWIAKYCLKTNDWQRVSSTANLAAVVYRGHLSALYHDLTLVYNSEWLCSCCSCWQPNVYGLSLKSSAGLTTCLPLHDCLHDESMLPADKQVPMECQICWEAAQVLATGK